MAAQARKSEFAKNVLLVIASVVMTLLLLALVEGGLRLAGIGADVQTSRLRYQHIYLPIMRAGSRPDGTPIWETIDPRLPYQTILKDKPASALRVVLFGGSATAGLGFSPNVTAARSLERMLTRAYPARTVEVLNLGIVALSAKQVRLLVEYASRQLAPDLLVVYSGNNEFLELHARKYAEAHATLVTSVFELLGRTHLYRVTARLVRGRPLTPSLSDRDFSQNELRLTQRQILRDISVSDGEIAAVIDGYETELEAIAAIASERAIPTLLMSVASNWEWRGRSDLPADWLDALLDSTGGTTPGRYQEAVRVIDARLPEVSVMERHELLFRRAEAHHALGDFEAARADYRAAMNEDPHLRRALDKMNERVGTVAERRGVGFIDVVDVLARNADHGIVGFEMFYDYVHFTPRGALLVGSAIFEEMTAAGIVAPAPGFDAERYVAERLAWLANLEEDPPEVRDWLGVGFDLDRIRERDLWKYDTMLVELDALLERDPRDARALTYRGNASFFRIDGAADAARDYRGALEVDPGFGPARANLELLLRDRQL